MITITGEITEKTAADVASILNEIDGEVSVFIDSAGGDLFAGLKIYDMLSDRDVKITVRRAGSVASVIALAGKEAPTVEAGGGFAIHNAHTKNIGGNHHDMRRVADSLEKYSQIVARIYQSKTNLSNAQAVSLMNDSTQIDSNDAVELGFAKEVAEAEMVENKLKLISQIINIDMTLLEKVKNNLGLTDTAPAPTVAAPAVPANLDGEEMPAEGAAFTEEQLAQVAEIVQTMIAEALAGTPTTEEVGNTIAVVLNQVISKGTPPASARITNEMNVAQTGIDAFNATMAKIKGEN